jgi:hypothetical protein
MYLAEFDYDITYIYDKENTVADALSWMADDIPNASLATCALTYTYSPPSLHTGGVLDITADHSLLESIINGYVDYNFAKQLTKDIAAGSIEDTTISNKLCYVGSRLVIPQDLQVQELLYNLTHYTLGHFGYDKSCEALCGSYYWPNTCVVTSKRHIHCDRSYMHIHLSTINLHLQASNAT